MRNAIIGLLLLTAAPAFAQPGPDLAASVHAAAAAACGGCVVGVHIVNASNPASWTLDFASGATPAQQAQAASALASFNLAGFNAVQTTIASGTIQIACAPGATVCTSAIAGTYRADAPAQAAITGIAAGISAVNRLPGGGSTFVFADAANVPHAFTAPQFLELAAAVEDFAYSLSQGTAPAQPVAIP